MRHHDRPVRYRRDDFYDPQGIVNVDTWPRIDRHERASVLLLIHRLAIDAARAGRVASAAGMCAHWRRVYSGLVEMDDQVTEGDRRTSARREELENLRNCEVGVALSGPPRCPSCAHLVAAQGIHGEPGHACPVDDVRAPLAARCARWMRDGGSDDSERARGARTPVVTTAH